MCLRADPGALHRRLGVADGAARRQEVTAPDEAGGCRRIGSRTLTVEADGTEVTTIEGLMNGEHLVAVSPRR